MAISRFAGVTVSCLLTVAGAPPLLVVHAATEGEVAAWSADAPLFRVFLKDGTALVSYGELARLDNRVVFSLPTAASSDHPQLHLVDIASDRVDWDRTVNYAEAARAARYVATRAETDYAVLTGDIAQILNDVTLAPDAKARLALVERARKTLSDWPSSHYRYKDADVRQMVAMLDEAIADLRAATGADRFDLTLTTTRTEAPRTAEPLLPDPNPKEIIEQTLAAARVTDSPVERTSLLSVAMRSLEHQRADLPADWAATMTAATSAAIARELEIDRAYDALSSQIVGDATVKARAADVRGVRRVLDQVNTRDKGLGGMRPDTVNAIVAAVEVQLDAARRLRLARDRWAIRLPELRRYRLSIGEPLRRLVEIRPALENIKALTGSGPDALGLILRNVAEVTKTTSALVPPEELSTAHSLLVNAAQLAERAARLRRQAALNEDMTRAWDASSAAAGALMLAARAQSEMQVAFRLPQLAR